MSRQYNEVKEQSHNEALELDRLKTQEAHIKDEHEEFEFEKMMATKVKIVALL